MAPAMSASGRLLIPLFNGLATAAVAYRDLGCGGAAAGRPAVMRRLASASVLLVAVAVLLAAPAVAQTSILDQAASRLRSDPVYVDPEADVAGDVDEDGLRQRIRASNAPIFVAVLPAAAIDEGGGDAGRLPPALATRTGLAGTYGVVAGRSFRGGSNTLAPGQGGALATAAFQAHRDDGIQAILEDFIERVSRAQAARGPRRPQPSGSGSGSPFDDGGGDASAGDEGGGGSSVLPVLLLAGAAGGGLWYFRRKKSRERVEDQRNRNVLEAQLAVLADDVVNLGPQVDLHPDARPDYEAAVSRYRVAQEALRATDQPIDLVRVGRLLDEAQYAMARAKAITEGREPPPAALRPHQPGRRGEPPVDLDERGQPAYVGGGSPFYGGGWFGGGGGGADDGPVPGPDAGRRLGLGRRPRHQRLRRQRR